MLRPRFSGAQASRARGRHLAVLHWICSFACSARVIELAQPDERLGDQILAVANPALRPRETLSARTHPLPAVAQGEFGPGRGTRNVCEQSFFVARPGHRRSLGARHEKRSGTVMAPEANDLGVRIVDRSGVVARTKGAIG